MAECHPVGFQWVMEAPRARRDDHPRGPPLHAHERGGRRARPDPGRHGHRVPRRPDQPRAAGRPLVPRVRRGVHERVDDHRRGLPGLRGPRRRVLGWDEQSKTTTRRLGPTRAWSPRPPPVSASRPRRRRAASAHGAHGAGLRTASRPRPTRRCSIRAASSRSSSDTSRATPRSTSRPSAASRRTSSRASRTRWCATRGRERTTAFVYSVGWTHHTTGTQYIRAAVHPPAAARQHRPAGRRHPCAARARVDPGVDGHPDALQHPARLPPDAPRRRRRRPRRLSGEQHPAGRLLGHTREYMVSLLKAWWGDAATAENEFGFDLLPRITGDHSIYPDGHGDARRRRRGLLRHGREPGRRLGQRQAAPAGHGEPQVARRPRPADDRVGDVLEGRARDRDAASCAPRTSAPRSSSSRPPRTPRRTAPSRTRSACCSGTTRRSSRRATAAAELHFMFHLVRRIREKLARLDATRATARSCDLTWDYPTRGPARGARRGGGAARDLRLHDRRRQGRLRLHASSRTTARPPAAAGSTPACYADEVNQAARRRPAREQTWVAPEWGWAWPMNRRILYNRASADPDGKPWSERKKLRLVGRRTQGSGPATTCPTSRRTRPPDYVPAARARRPRRAARRRAVHHAGRRQGLAATCRAASSTGRCPSHYEPHESPVAQPAATRQQASPTRQQFAAARQPLQPDAGDPGADVFPFALMTYRHRRAPHGRRHVALPALPRRARAGDVRRGLARAGRAARPGARRVGDRRHDADGDRGARARDRAAAPLPSRGRSSTRSGCRTTGAPAGSRPATRRTTCCRSCSTATCTSPSSRPRRATSGRARPRGPRCRVREATGGWRRSVVTEYQPPRAGRRRRR